MPNQLSGFSHSLRNEIVTSFLLFHFEFLFLSEISYYGSASLQIINNSNHLRPQLQGKSKDRYYTPLRFIVASIPIKKGRLAPPPPRLPF